MTSLNVAKRLVNMLASDGKLWLIERGKPVWVRIKIARAISCGCCGGIINEGELGDLFCVDYSFRKICLEVFCEFCARQLKRHNALVNAIYEVMFNGRGAM
jgi:hypothetical protein